jgi:hypothetical protein
MTPTRKVDFIFFGLVSGLSELGYFSLSELERVRARADCMSAICDMSRKV